MKNHLNQELAKFQVVPKHIAEMPERERQAMQEARKNGLFNGKAHLANSPVARAMAHGFPVPIR